LQHIGHHAKPYQWSWGSAGGPFCFDVTGLAYSNTMEDQYAYPDANENEIPGPFHYGTIIGHPGLHQVTAFISSIGVQIRLRHSFRIGIPTAITM
jgi:hypothetical protein